jgi:hypothetical protein
MGKLFELALLKCRLGPIGELVIRDITVAADFPHVCMTENSKITALSLMSWISASLRGTLSHMN